MGGCLSASSRSVYSDQPPSTTIADPVTKPYHLINLATGAVEHPFGTLKMRMGATHFLMKRPPKVATEMALHVTQNDLWSFRSVSRPRNRRKSQSARLRVLASQSEVGFWTRSETFLRNQDPQET
jgi:hypothetical protein